MCDNTDRSATKWLKKQFECEYCCECGGDAEHHTAMRFLGNWFARCDYPRDRDTGALHPVIERFREQAG